MNVDSVELLNDSFLFKFNDEVTSDGFFRHDSELLHIITKDVQESNRRARLVTVLRVGPKAKDLTVGETVVVEALAWTKQFKIGDDTVWMSDERRVIAKVED